MELSGASGLKGRQGERRERTGSWFSCFLSILNFLTKEFGDEATSLLWKEGCKLITACLLPGFALEKNKTRISKLFKEEEKHTKKCNIVPSLVGNC